MSSLFSWSHYFLSVTCKCRFFDNSDFISKSCNWQHTQKNFSFLFILLFINKNKCNTFMQQNKCQVLRSFSNMFINSPDNRTSTIFFFFIWLHNFPHNCLHPLPHTEAVSLDSFSIYHFGFVSFFHLGEDDLSLWLILLLKMFVWSFPFSWVTLAKFVYLLTVKSFHANDMFACDTE